jgi:heptosyltransferase I
MALVPQSMEERPQCRIGVTMSQRFLISRLSSLGDVVCSLPAASALKAIEEAHITWVVDSRFADVVRACSAVDEVIDRREFQGGNFDVALDLQGLLKSALIMARAKAPTKVGYHWQREGAALFSQRVVPDPSSLHVVDQYVDVARAVGGIADRAQFAIEPEEAAIDSVRAKLGQLATEPFVVMNPGAAWATKRWPPQHFAKLIHALPIKVVLIGSRGETGAEEILRECKAAPLNLSGQTTIAELIALISLAKAHVGGDTGSTHIAAALGVPAIGLYSATRPERSCPYGQIDRCHYDPAGLSQIKPEDVYRTVLEATA